MGKYLLQDTPSGLPTLVYVHEGRTRIHSAYDPLKEAKKSIEGFSPGRASVIIVCGLGLGYHLTEIRRKHPALQIIALEKDPEVIEIARKCNPDALKDVLLVASSADIPDALEFIDMASFRGAVAFRHRPSYLLFKDFYDALERDVHQYFSSRLSDMLTRFEFAERWAENILSNAHHLFTAIPVKSLFGKFRGIPGIIVSAGPSLRKNAAFLKEAREKALIVCVDTALKILEKHGISPHIVMTLDAQRHSVRHFLGVRAYESVLLADLVSCPAVLRDWKGIKMLSTTSKFINTSDGRVIRETTPLVDWLEKWVESPGDIQSGGSVATSAFDLLLNLGCAPIVLIGQDLAYTGREIHCSGSHHNEEWIALINRFRNLECINQNVIRKRKAKYVEGYCGKGTVISDFVFDLYRSWFADSAGKVPVKVINATEGGARIANTVERPISEVIAAMPEPRKSPAALIADSLSSSPSEKPAKLHQAAENVLSAIHSIAARTRDNASDAEAIIKEGLQGEAAPVIAPMLKKTHVYLARHPELPAERAAELLTGDIIKAIERIRPHIARLHDRLARLV